MASDLISKKALIDKINDFARKNFSLDDRFEYQLQGMEIVLGFIEEAPTVEVIDVHSEIDINDEVRKPPERYMKEMLARGLAKELEQYIIIKKYPGMFHNTVFHGRIKLVSWGGENG